MTGAASITGLGIVSALGTGRQAHIDAMLAGRDGLRPVSRFDTAGFTSTIAGTWPHWDGRLQQSHEGGVEPSDDFSLFDIALVAAQEALRDAKLATNRRVALVLGTCFGKGFREFHSITERLAKTLSLDGLCVTISTACASSTNALGLARDILSRHEADVVIAGGADVLLQEVFAGFSSLGVLSTKKCAPFSEPHGTNLAEGAGFLVLERPQDASARGAKSYGAIYGYGLSSDGYHETTPDPTGAGISRAIRGALNDAGWSRDSVDFVSAHATGTTNNDRIEWSAIQRELGEVSLCGSKSQVGHAQGAAGVIELILALLAMSMKKVPATLHFQGARAGCPSDPMAGETPREKRVTRAIKLSSAFGGANASLTFSPLPAEESSATTKRSRIILRGIGLAGSNTDAEIFGARTPARDVIPVDPRRLDVSSRLLVSAANACFSRSKVPLPKGAARERAGVFIGAPHMPEESAKKCSESMKQNGIARASATAFARMSVNSPTGTCARLFGLLGPSSTLSIGEGSGLAALVLAAEWLSVRQDADLLLAGAVNEPIKEEPLLAEAAACVLLTREDKVAPEQIELLGWGLGAKREQQALIHRVRRGHNATIFCDGPLEGEPNARDISQHYSSSGATRSLLALAAAVYALQEREIQAALVCTTQSSSTSCAVLLTRSEA